MGQVGKTIATSCNQTLAFGESLLKDITPAMFARQPNLGGKLIDCNHPAWVYGHLAIYPFRCMELMGLPAGETLKPANFDALFQNKTICHDDPKGTIYPGMEEIVGFYKKAYRALLSTLPEVSDELLARPTLLTGRMAEIFPSVGDGVNFLASAHAMSHLGQVSTWRRCMGLGSAH